MARENEYYRDNLEAILAFTGGTYTLNIRQVREFTGIRHYQTLHKRSPFGADGYISAPTLARCLARGEATS